MYTIKEAAGRAGVGVPLLRAWERRYGIVQPARTAAGYRLYDEEAIERVRAMRQLVDDGWTASQAAHRIQTLGLPERIVDALPDRRGDATSHLGSDQDLGSLLVESATELDTAAIQALLDDTFATGSFERTVDDRLMPALQTLGDAWAAGLVSVAGEHAASYAVIRRLSAAFEAAGRDVATDRPVLVGLPMGSRHEIGTLAFATALRRRGIRTIYLGADVPLESWIDAVRRTEARAIVIGVPTPADVAQATAIARAAAGIDGLLVALGGSGAATARASRSLVVLSDGIGASASTLEAMLAKQG